MGSTLKDDMLYMGIAQAAATMSVDPKHQVGCAIVTPKRVFSISGCRIRFLAQSNRNAPELPHRHPES
jgi:deoxycytidylate deaminase